MKLKNWSTNPDEWEGLSNDTERKEAALRFSRWLDAAHAEYLTPQEELPKSLVAPMGTPHSAYRCYPADLEHEEWPPKRDHHYCWYTPYRLDWDFVYTSQPYCDGAPKDLLAWARARSMVAVVTSELSWHFPGSTVLQVVAPRHLMLRLAERLPELRGWRA